MNCSLSSSQVPAQYKQAVLDILSKKIPDHSLPQITGLSLKLPFLSRILEKVVAKQLTTAIAEHNIPDKVQSGFRRLHSTETALLRVSNDILMKGDAGECSVLVLLDLSAVFDTVDHCVLVERLEQWVGVSGSALQWFSSYLSDGSFSVSVGSLTSSSDPLFCGVPRGSVLVTILFALYMLLLGQIRHFKRHLLSLLRIWYSVIWLF